MEGQLATPGVSARGINSEWDDISPSPPRVLSTLSIPGLQHKQQARFSWIPPAWAARSSSLAGWQNQMPSMLL